MRDWFKRLRSWIFKWANTKWGVLALFICAFAEASILGFPTPLLFLALTLVDTKKVYKYIFFGILGTLSGAIAGYAIGHFAWLNANGDFSKLAQFLFNNIPGFTETGYNRIQVLYEKWDFWILFVAAALPLPFKIFSISSGVFDINLLIFCVSTLISQGLKYFILALLVIKLGPEVKKLFEYNWKPLAIIATAGIALAVILVKVF